VNRSILARLIALGVVTVLGFYYIAFDAIGYHLPGVDGPYQISVAMPVTEPFGCDAASGGPTSPTCQQIPAGAGGLYTDAYVTYRGVAVGKVAALNLHPDGVTAVLNIDHGVKIPDNVTAAVKELTAAAEQYIDLEPMGGTASPTSMAAGATIPSDRTTVPVSIGELLDSLNNLVDNLSASDLNTLSSALATGLVNAGGNLRQIIVDSNALVTALQTAATGTSQLINSGSTVLSTFNATGASFTQFSTNLSQLSAYLAQNNSTLVRFLQSGAQGATSLNGFLAKYGNDTVGFIDNLATATDTAYQRQDAFRALFEVLPLFATNVAATVQGGQVHFQVDFNSSSPVCSYTPMLPEPTQVDNSPANLGNYCPSTAPGMLARGAATAPPPHS
jgi:phospholipid/cholesterol/gamma-HCH transport system substrate-binding protein